MPAVDERGLTAGQVADRVAHGQTNVQSTKTTRTVGQIIAANVFTLFNGIILAAMIVVLLTGRWKDAVFGFVIIVNTLIGVVTELKSKRTLDKLSILVKSRNLVRRDGRNEEVDAEDIVEGDVLWIRAGEQVPADCEVLESWGLELDESMLTGESATVKKKPGDKALSGATAVQTAAAGYFSGSTDGCEGTLTPAFLEGVTPSRLNGLSASAAVKSAGKIITSSTWYYAAVLPAAEAEGLEVGQEVTLRLSKGLKQDTPAYVWSVSDQEDGQVAVVFTCNRYISQVTLLRRQQAEIILREYSGIRIPTAALRMDESGQMGVYCQIGAYVYLKPVDLIYKGSGFCLVESAEGASGERVLRQGDLVISTAQQLTDGMILPDT